MTADHPTQTIIMKSGKENNESIRGNLDYKFIFDEFPDAIFIIASDDHFLFANKRAVECYGHSLEELSLMKVEDETKNQRFF
jgi:PAS domain-containing protein